jgi:hypothetical protein
MHLYIVDLARIPHGAIRCEYWRTIEPHSAAGGLKPHLLQIDKRVNAPDAQDSLSLIIGTLGAHPVLQPMGMRLRLQKPR